MTVQRGPEGDLKNVITFITQGFIGYEGAGDFASVRSRRHMDPG